MDVRNRTPEKKRKVYLGLGDLVGCAAIAKGDVGFSELGRCGQRGRR